MMKKILMLTVMIAVALSLSFCEKEAEISTERYKMLVDTMATEMDYEPWMEFALEMSMNYPEEYAAGMIMVQAAERSLMEQDEKRFDILFEYLKQYPENGALELTDQIAFGNRLAWIMADQMLLFKKAPGVMEFTINKFKKHEVGLQWRNELGAMIYDTQASVFEGMDELDKALEAYNTALEYFEQPETLLRRGLILESRGDLQGALEDFITALRHSPNQVMIINKVKEVYATLNPGQDVTAFFNDLQESLLESRKEEVLGEAFFNDAPEFDFTDFSGGSYTNSSMLGKVLFVDFWATWCSPCRRELPEFQAFYDLHKDNSRVAFIAASTDRELDKVKPFIQELGFTFPVAYAGESATKFGVEGIPSLFIIGPSGKIRYKIVGFDPDKDFVREMSWRLESLLDS
ncbi:MAG: redoxin domain-containing protein [Candidatus Marinimicrobia bacterium]|nr:redoxin domain-containing protein [Candidatus Neomarinimicrobiota bacterium]